MDERKRFEEWYEVDAMPLEADWFKKDSDGDYDRDDTACSWRAWRAAVAAERERCIRAIWELWSGLTDDEKRIAETAIREFESVDTGVKPSELAARS